MVHLISGVVFSNAGNAGTLQPGETTMITGNTSHRDFFLSTIHYTPFLQQNYITVEMSAGTLFTTSEVEGKRVRRPSLVYIC